MIGWIVEVGAIVLGFRLKNNQKNRSSLLGKHAFLEYELDELRNEIKDLRRLIDYRIGEINRLKRNLSKTIKKDEIEEEIMKLKAVTKRAAKRLEELKPSYKAKIRKLSFLDELDIDLLRTLYQNGQMTSNLIKQKLETEKSDRTIRRHCNRLTKLGVLHKERGKGKRNLYSLSEKGEKIYEVHLKEAIELGPIG